MSHPSVRCELCGYEMGAEWGPETHSTIVRMFVEHVTSHADYELRDYAIKVLLGRRGV